MPSRALAMPSRALAMLSLLLVVPSGAGGVEQLQQTFSELVSSGNSSYYQLRRTGLVHLVLLSQQGDADLYVSGDTLLPDYSNYDYKSATCGIDEVTVPSNLQRPIGIAVYVYSVLPAQFQLKVYVDTDLSEGGQESGDAGKQHGHMHHSSSFPGSKEDEESLIWTIFISVLKVVFDILVG